MRQNRFRAHQRLPFWRTRLAGCRALKAIRPAALADVEHVYGLERRDVPIDLKPRELSVFRSATSGDEPEIKWFHELVLKAAKVLTRNG